MRARRVLWIAGLLLCEPTCISPSVVESSGRAVAPASVELEWRPAREEDLRGLFESVSIEGEAAASLSRVLYFFGADGSYSGAALVLGAANPEFQTLTGRWSLAGEVLDLGDGQTATVSAADDHLRLATPMGVVVLRRMAVQ